MMKKSRSRTRRSRGPLISRGCYFCLEKISHLSYKDPAHLAKFISQRGKIIQRSRTGVCAAHQRILSRAIKIARINAILPFKESSLA